MESMGVGNTSSKEPNQDMVRSYDEPEKAAQAYDAALYYLCGARGRFNFPTDLSVSNEFENSCEVGEFHVAAGMPEPDISCCSWYARTGYIFAGEFSV
ncbi:hypothetical protein HHK36_026206 [Tetracentron sinense]|uniref:AP2/ERF domain-containing protein n=1 Tax=Tetracentron sinense TaxID=13715 RepID=A0A834YPR3_TETSI|nr:hypothetical protein HHK36_026206 [Tetracentron sinense]